MSVLTSYSVAGVLDQIEQALRLVEPPDVDVQAMESAYLQVLGGVCSLTEDEANLVEPAFTALEEQFSNYQPSGSFPPLM